MNGLLISILLTAIMLSGSIFSTNYFLLNMLPNIPGIVIALIALSITSFILGVIISTYASKTNCDKTDKKNAFKMGLKTILHAVIGYILVYFVSFIRNPFLEVFGDQALGYSIAQSFVIVLNTISATIINYYDSIQISCKVPQEVIDKNLKKLDKYLNKKPTKKKVEMITVKD